MIQIIRPNDQFPLAPHNFINVRAIILPVLKDALDCTAIVFRKSWFVADITQSESFSSERCNLIAAYVVLKVEYLK